MTMLTMILTNMLATDKGKDRLQKRRQFDRLYAIGVRHEYNQIS
jgi:hypothetical protein